MVRIPLQLSQKDFGLPRIFRKQCRAVSKLIILFSFVSRRVKHPILLLLKEREAAVVTAVEVDMEVAAAAVVDTAEVAAVDMEVVAVDEEVVVVDMVASLCLCHTILLIFAKLRLSLSSHGPSWKPTGY